MRVVTGDSPLAIVGLPGEAARAVAASRLADPARGVSVIASPGEVTLVLPWSMLDEAREAFPSARVEGPFRMLTLDVPLAWDVVGFFAVVTRALADAGIVIAALSSFAKDHVLVKEHDAAKAREVLAGVNWGRAT